MTTPTTQAVAPVSKFTDKINLPLYPNLSTISKASD